MADEETEAWVSNDTQPVEPWSDSKTGGRELWTGPSLHSGHKLLMTANRRSLHPSSRASHYKLFHQVATFWNLHMTIYSEVFFEYLSLGEARNQKWSLVQV